MTARSFDLHCHSTFSDGSLTPHEVVQLALKQHLEGMAITDHDTFAAYFDISGVKELKILSGIEISTEHKHESIHVLGLAFDPQCQKLMDFCLAQRQGRLERNRRMLEKLTAKGMPLLEEEIVTSTNPWQTYGRVHIALAMVNKGYVKDVQQAFQRHIGDGKSCYVTAPHATVQEAIDVIHEAKGKAVLAHPHLIKRSNVLKAVLAMPFDGIEAFYGKFSHAENLKWCLIAKERGWFMTGGSDFHGQAKPNVQLGCALTPPDVFDQLFAHFQQVMHAV